MMNKIWVTDGANKSMNEKIKNIQLRVNAIWYDMITMFSLLILTTLVFKSDNVITSMVCLIAFLVVAILCQIFEAKENTKIKNGN